VRAHELDSFSTALWVSAVDLVSIVHRDISGSSTHSIAVQELVTHTNAVSASSM
jgi:hypothetical protein